MLVGGQELLEEGKTGQREHPCAPGLGRGPVGTLVGPGAQAAAVSGGVLFCGGCMWATGFSGLVSVPPMIC